MKFQELLEIVGDTPVFSSALLRAGDVDLADIASQLSRWVKSGKLIALRRGVYALGTTYSRRAPHPFEVANLLQRPSYVSMESALSYYGMLPEAAFATASVTSGRGGAFDTPLGTYLYQHVAPGLFWGYSQETVAQAGAVALVAKPEKALLDLVYIRPGADDPAFLRQLRLQRLSVIDMDLLAEYAERSGKPKLVRAARAVAEIARVQEKGWVEL